MAAPSASTATQKSTNVRAFSDRAIDRAWGQTRTGKGFLAARLLLAVAERTAPGLGARLAVRLWLTVPSAARTAADGRTAAGNATADRTAEPAGRRDLLDGGVVAQTWGDGPAVYLMHGWGGHRGQFGAFIEPLASAGYRVIAIDAPGHGESGPGRHGRGRASMLDFIGALQSAVARYGRPHAVIGHSFGGSAVAVAALDGLKADRLVLISPVADVASGLDYFARTVGIGPRIAARMTRQIERVTRRSAGDFDVPARAAECEELPRALVIHDSRDKEVPFGNGALIAGAWPDSRLLSTEGLGHRRILRDAGLVSSVVGYLDRSSASLWRKGPRSNGAAAAGHPVVAGRGGRPSRTWPERPRRGSTQLRSAGGPCTAVRTGRGGYPPIAGFVSVIDAVGNTG